MNIRLFLLKNDQNSYAARLLPELKYIFSAYLPEDGVREYGSLREAADDVAAAFSDSHVILFFAEPALFAETKQILASSINLPLHCDRALFEKAAETERSLADENSAFAVTHAYLPDNARALACADGLYTGFSVSSGNQTVFLLPLERGRTEFLLSGTVLPQINAAYQSHLDMNVLRTYNARRLKTVCEANDVRIAVAGTNTADYFRDYISSEKGLAERIEFSDKAEKRGSLSPADYVVNLSITAAEFYGTPYGVAISNAFYSGDDPSGEKIIYLAITNEYETALREVRSVPGEEIPSLLSRCCGDLCTFLADIAGTDAKKRVISGENERSLISQYKRVIIGVALVAAALAVFCGVYFSMHGYTLKTWAANAWAAVFPGSKPIFTEETSTTESVTETTLTVPAATTKREETTASAPTTTAAATTAPQRTTASGSSSGSSSGTTARSSSGSGTTAAPITQPATEATTAREEPSSAAPTTEPATAEPPASQPEPSEEPTASEEPSSANGEEGQPSEQEQNNAEEQEANE